MGGIKLVPSSEELFNTKMNTSTMPKQSWETSVTVLSRYRYFLKV